MRHEGPILRSVTWADVHALAGIGGIVGLGLEGLDRLSKTSDHVGNLANVLKDLGGPTTILHELTQNADDASSATRVRFTVTGDELVAWNDGQFTSCGDQRSSLCSWKVERGRSCDLHSFRTFAGRHKAQDTTTTGAFGVGFTSVYQIADHPELVTSGEHLVLDESADEGDRIRVCTGCARDHDTVGTSFFLPFARLETELRTALGVQVVTDEIIDALEDALTDQSAEALIFLARVEQIDVETRTRSSNFRRVRDGERVSISSGSGTSEWLLLEGKYDTSADLKSRFSAIDHKRSELIQVAIASGSRVAGRIYAGLPTQTELGWSGHVNASFYPRQDRKGVTFDDGTFRSEWNRDLIDSAAHVIAANLQVVHDAIGSVATWELIKDIELASRETSKLDSAFRLFNGPIRDAAATLPIVATTAGDLRHPRGCLLPQTLEEYSAAEALETLGLDVVVVELRPIIQQLTLSAFGIELLRTKHVVDALQHAGVTEPWSPGTEGLSASSVEGLLVALDIMIARARSAADDAGLARVAVAPCLDGRFAPPEKTVDIPNASRGLFSDLGEDLIVDRARLRSLSPAILQLCPELSVPVALDILESADPDHLASRAPAVLEWLDEQRSGLHDEDARSRAAELPIFPTSSRGLERLTVLSLPSDFEDVLGLADLVDVSKVDGHIDLLSILGATRLDALGYLKRYIVPLAADPAIFRGADTLRPILEIVRKAQPQLDDDKVARDAVRSAPLALCVDGIVRIARDVHLSNAAIELIDPNAPIADVRDLHPHHIDTLVWLGVGRVPGRRLLNDAAERLAIDHIDPDPKVVVAILEAVRHLAEEAEAVPSSLRNLVALPWLPIEGGGRSTPGQVYPTFRRFLFASQGPMLGLPQDVQSAHIRTLRWLGMPSDPSTAMIIAHLRHCATTGTSINKEVYRVLADAKEEEAVRSLRAEKCIQVAEGVFVEPNYVYWTESGFGRWVTTLPPDYRAFQAFFDRVGVSEAPSPIHVEKLLMRISQEMSTNYVDDETSSVVHQCWRRLQLHLLDHESDVVASLERLGKVRSAVDARGLMTAPQHLIFRDGRGATDRIGLISHNVIRRERDTWRALESAGVIPAENVIALVLDDGPREPSAEIADLLSDRRRSLERVIDAERHDEDGFLDTEQLFDMKFLSADQVKVKYRAEFANHVETTESFFMQAVYVEPEHTIHFSKPPDLRRIAQEIARAIVGEEHPGLALQLDVVLRADSVEDAEAELDELGVADLTEVAREVIEAAELEDFDDPVSHEGSDHLSAPDAGSHRNVGDAVTEGNGDSHATEDEGARAGRTASHVLPGERLAESGTSPDSDHDAGGARAESRAGSSRSSASTVRRKETRRHLRSYVSIGGDAEDESRGEESLRNSSIDRAGVSRVLDFERSQGRVPSEQSHANPGFDVLSTDERGDIVRRIEIKSIGGPWTETGVLMSKRQHEEAVEFPGSFWLYVVENARDDDLYEIHRIPNPAESITHFGFDDGWRVVREPDE